MKTIKENPDYYHRIEGITLRRMLPKSIEFSKGEFNFISNFLKNNIIESACNIKWTDDYKLFKERVNTINIFIDDFPLRKLIVIKFEDEWYFMNVEGYFYLCDQLDGVAEMLNNFKINLYNFFRLYIFQKF